MKNLLIYTNAAKEFNEENKTLVKIHIDNSLRLGWNRDDILLYTNFPYEYNGVKAIEVDDSLDLIWDRSSNKIFVIQHLLERKELPDDLYWYHDFDAYENEAIVEDELDIDNFAVTGYGYKDQVNGGSFFFRLSAKPIFDLWCKRTRAVKRTRADEKSMTDMTRDGSLKNYKMLDITYNFGQRCPNLCYKYAQKPIKVLHFHPYYRYYESKEENINIFMYGKNLQKKPMMSKGLIEIFQKHGIK